MSESTVYLERIRRLSAAVATEATGWHSAVRGYSAAVVQKKTQMGQALTLQLRSSGREGLDLSGAFRSMPSTYDSITDPAVRNATMSRFESIALKVLVSQTGLVQALSDIAFEVATCRVLVTVDDVYDVSEYSVLLALSAINLIRLAGGPQDETLTHRFKEQVEWPLALADRSSASLRPGDLWFADLMARTLRVMSKNPAGNNPKDQAATALIRKVLPHFVSRSLLNKLVEVDQFGQELAEKARFRHWPGLACLLADDGARSLRTFVVGEVSRRVVIDEVGYSQRACLRFLEGLLSIADDPDLMLKARLLIGTLFLEMLGQDEEVLGRLMWLGQEQTKEQTETIKPAKRASKAGEAGRVEDIGKVIVAAAIALHEAPTIGNSDDLEHLSELRSCLQTYQTYVRVVKIFQSQRRTPSTTDQAT